MSRVVGGVHLGWLRVFSRYNRYHSGDAKRDNPRPNIYPIHVTSSQTCHRAIYLVTEYWAGSRDQNFVIGLMIFRDMQ